MSPRAARADVRPASSPAVLSAVMSPRILIAAAAALLGSAEALHAAGPITPPAPISVSPGTPASAPGSTRPSKAAAPMRPAAGNGGTDCAELQRRYLESQACFAPYRLATGGLDADAFRHCTVVQDPSPRCGLPHLQQP